MALLPSLFAGGQILYLGISSLTNYTALNVKVKIHESVVQIKAQTNYGISVVLPSLPNGLYNISISLNCITLRATR